MRVNIYLGNSRVRPSPLNRSSTREHYSLRNVKAFSVQEFSNPVWKDEHILVVGVHYCRLETLGPVSRDHGFTQV